MADCFYIFNKRFGGYAQQNQSIKLPLKVYAFCLIKALNPGSCIIKLTLL